ncbi:copper resistance CopC family protein [Actinomadura oligospora]|uniref:copper resistance CopC family protein n=1 Tax=Actinomadura oligospora TaxID=111804 RepID=UPI0007E8E599|nr:copper resistance protein CopC [Actinomadura oligospora]
MSSKVHAPLVRARRIGVVAALAGVSLAGFVPSASAHTALKKSDPASGATVASPSKITLTYSEPVGHPKIILTDASGGRHEAGSARAVDNVVTEDVKGPLSDGVYTVGWRAVSDDGHPVTGEFTFTVKGSPSTSPSASASSAASAPVSAAPSESSSSSDGGGSAGWLWIGLGAVVLAAIGGVVAWTRRSRTS